MRVPFFRVIHALDFALFGCEHGCRRTGFMERISRLEQLGFFESISGQNGDPKSIQGFHSHSRCVNFSEGRGRAKLDSPGLGLILC
jgi:hypothetical protein